MSPVRSSLMFVIVTKLINSVQTSCIVKGEAQKSPLFWRFSGSFWFSQERLFSWNSTRKPFKFNKIPDFTNTPCKPTCLYNAPSMHTVEINQFGQRCFLCPPSSQSLAVNEFCLMASRICRQFFVKFLVATSPKTLKDEHRWSFSTYFRHIFCPCRRNISPEFRSRDFSDNVFFCNPHPRRQPRNSKNTVRTEMITI